ncbi:RGS13 [Acrasis kona]|uniref:RGS13 n=1 Tax=Acrasis kona TaxID=1008807 RepID=A0AAW2YHT7_9EUKA
MKYMNYEVQFDSVFTEEGLQCNYKKYLTKSHQLEPLLFLLDVKSFREKPILESAKAIIQKYILVGSKYEINLSADDRNYIVKHDDTGSENIFDVAYCTIYHELRSDSFHRYLSSQEFVKFIQKKDTRYLDTIAIDLSKASRKKMLPSPFTTEHITDQDIESLIRMNDCVSDWVSLRPTYINEKEKEYYGYMSKHKYNLSKTEQIISKFTGTLKVSAEHLLYSLLDDRNKHHWMQYVKVYDNINVNIDHEYSFVNVYSELHLTKILTPRDNLSMATLLYDSERRCYMWVCKSNVSYDKRPLRTHRRLNDLVDLNCMFIYDTGENTCRYTYLLFGDHGLKSMEFLHRVIAKKLSKKFHKQFIEMCLLKDPVRDGQLQNTLKDFKSRYLSEPGSRKTWAEDLLNGAK